MARTGRIFTEHENMRHRPLLGALAILLTCHCMSLAADKVQSHPLKSKRAPNAVDRVEAILEVSGSLKVIETHAKDPKKATSVAMKATAALAYAEKSLKVPASENPLAQAVRYYDKAEASIQVGDGTFKPTLRDERRLVAVEVRSPRIVIFSPKGSLTREELDLVGVGRDGCLPLQGVVVGVDACASREPSSATGRRVGSQQSEGGNGARVVAAIS